MSNNTVPFLQKAAWAAACVQVVIVGFSGFLILSQLRQQKLNLDQQLKLSRAANTQTLAGLLAPLNLKLTDREMAELSVKGFNGINQITDPQEQAIQRERLEVLLASGMVFYENVYSQHLAGLLDQKIYEAWHRTLVGFLDAPGMEEFWNKRKKFYHKDFGDHVDQIFVCLKSTPRQALCQ